MANDLTATTALEVLFRSRPSYAYARVHLASRQVIGSALAPHELTVTEYGVLRLVQAEPGVTNAELARLLSVTPQSMIRTVLGLTTRGLLERHRHPTQGRALATLPTPACIALLDAATPIVDAAEAKLTGFLEPADKAWLVEALNQIADRALTQLDDASPTSDDEDL